MQNDPFAEAFADMAEERRKMPFDEFIALLKEAYDELQEETGSTPDISVIMAAGSDIATLGNGITDERALWLMELVKFNLFTSGGE